MRAAPPAHMGRVFIVESGSYFISGSMNIVGWEGPVSVERWEELRAKHLVPGDRLYGARTFVWHVTDAGSMLGVPCGHTSQVTWIRHAESRPRYVAESRPRYVCVRAEGVIHRRLDNVCVTRA